MAKQLIGRGSTANDGTGDNLRDGANKVNLNFNEIYTAIGDGTNVDGTIKIADDSSTVMTLSANGETVRILGGTGISSTISSNDLTLAVDGTVLSASQVSTLTNKTINGPDNTLTNIANGSLSNSTITLAGDSGSTAIDLGDTLTVNGTANQITTAQSGDTLTLSLPSAITTPGSLTVTGNFTVQGTQTVVDSTTIEVTNSFTFEGTTSDEFETVLTVTDPTADRTITLPNATGTLISHGMFSGDATVATNGALTLATVNSNVGQAGSATAIPVVTVNAKGLVTAVSTASITTTLTIGADSGSNDTVSLASDTLDFSGGSNITTTVSNNDISIALDASPSVTNLTVGGNIVFEGSTADSFETTLGVTDPTADRTVTIPNKSGTVAMTSDTSFPQSTLTEHPAAQGNADLAGGETPFEAIVDAFQVITSNLFDHMEPRGSVDTVDLGSVA